MQNRFDFGINWAHYSDKALNEEKFEYAKKSLSELFQQETFKGLSFLDIGCGSGLFSIAAKALGADSVLGVDISPYSINTCVSNVKRLKIEDKSLSFNQLDVLEKIKTENLGLFDLVYCWGVLHHTGRMWEAMDIVCRRVKPGGRLALGIYKKHVTSPLWHKIKKIYNYSPKWFQKILILFFYPIIFMVKWPITFKHPFHMKRGMDFYYDVVDWVGGYPYEYATAEEVTRFVEARGFKRICFNPAWVPIGNNEFVFIKQ